MDCKVCRHVLFQNCYLRRHLAQAKGGNFEVFPKNWTGMTGYISGKEQNGKEKRLQSGL